jgi:FAD/FMN-containing dehydrogenase
MSMDTLQATTLAGGTTVIPGQDLETFLTEMQGEVVRPSDRIYDDARHIYNGMIDKRPAMIARCDSTQDVVAALNFGRAHDLLVSVRGGGHSGPGLALCEGGLVIDLSAMNGVQVDRDKRTATVQGGATWGRVDRATHAYGLATVSGVISTTGVGGLTLGGGHGYLAPKHGLTIDNLLDTEVVLADGRIVRANAGEHQDLFWALRGGGGNFGVVTSFTFRLHPVDRVIAGPTLWPLDQAADVLRWYRDWVPRASEDLYGFFAFLEVPPASPFPLELHGRKMCGIVWCYTGLAEHAEAAFAPVHALRPKLFGVHEMPYPELQSAFDALYPPGLQWYWKGDFFNELSNEAIERHLAHAAVPTMLSTMHLYPINGAVHDVPADETAWSYRDATWSMVIAGVADTPEHNKRMTTWARQYWDALHPYSAGGAYLNFLMEEGRDRIRATYRGNYDRLAKVKANYDPSNLFRVNQNVPPKA